MKLLIFVSSIHIYNKYKLDNHTGFGNYVTCKWWDDLWLNEAMATWLSYKPFTAKYPDWNMVEYFLFI
jgi:aminopeptidase N